MLQLLDYLPRKVRQRVVLGRVNVDFERLRGLRVKLATTEAEMLGAARLVHDAYVARGIIGPHPSRLMLHPQMVLPTSMTFVALLDDAVIGTISLVGDSPLGLPLDRSFRDEMAGLRARGEHLAEVSALAVAPEHRRSGVAYLLNRLTIRTAVQAKIDRLVMSVHPRAETLYRTAMLFEKFGGERAYTGLTAAPAIAMSLPVGDVVERYRDAFEHLGPVPGNAHHLYFAMDCPEVKDVPAGASTPFEERAAACAALARARMDLFRVLPDADLAHLERSLEAVLWPSRSRPRLGAPVAERRPRRLRSLTQAPMSASTLPRRRFLEVTASLGALAAAQALLPGCGGSEATEAPGDGLDGPPDGGSPDSSVDGAPAPALPAARVTGVAGGQPVDVTVQPGECKLLVTGDFQRGCVMYYADGAVVIENAYAGDGNPTPGDLPCNLTVAVGGRTFQTGDIVVWYHCWTRPFWIVEPKIRPLDPSTLPPYGPGSEGASYAAAYAKADNSIMGRGLSAPGMSTSGERADIGLYPGWDSAYVTNPTSENAAVVRGMSDSVGAWPIHTRDTRTNEMLIGADYPKASMLDVFRGIEGNPFKKFTTACKNVPNVAHATAFNALAAQLFATDYDKASLSQWTNWVGRLWQNYTYLTDVPEGPATTPQTRGMAWLLRTVVQGARWSDRPDLFRPWATKLASFLQAKWSAQVGIHVDQFSGGGYPNGGIAPWQNHYLVSALGHAVQLGFTEFQWPLDYLAELVIESALADHELATVYNNSCFDPDTKVWVANWAAGLQLSRTFSPKLDAALALPEGSLERLKAVYPPDGTGYQAGDFVGYPWAPDGYPAIRQPAAAYAAMFATDQTRARQAWEVTAQHMRADFSKNPKYNIVPRST